MEAIARKSFQGITNIIRFNWQYYVIAIILIAVSFLFKDQMPVSLQPVFVTIAVLALAGIIISLAVSWFIYDHSGLYSFEWLKRLQIEDGKQLVNINAGFDESSAAIAQKYPGSKLLVFDLYDPSRHTEISIERARKAYPPYPGTIMIDTTDVPLAKKSSDHIFLFFTAHEIRKDDERAKFFTQLCQALKHGGTIIVTEHQRDLYNFMAYNIGFFHFFSIRSWKRTFLKAGLDIESSFKITPFISTFILVKNGAPA